jgi:UDP-N-acetylglucosamine 2-epimerase (non-hydrolysing)
MIDSLLANREHAISPQETLRRNGKNAELISKASGFGVVTLHRPSNVDNAEALKALLSVLREVSDMLPLVLALHPRTRTNIQRFGLDEMVSGERIIVLPPQGYLEMIGLLAGAKVVLTDSGGIQEETTALGVPCITLRENTERPITIEQGTNILAGSDRVAIMTAVAETLKSGGKRGRVPEFWDGRAAERIVSHLADWVLRRHSCTPT